MLGTLRGLFSTLGSHRTFLCAFIVFTRISSTRLPSLFSRSTPLYLHRSLFFVFLVLSRRGEPHESVPRAASGERRWTSERCSISVGQFSSIWATSGNPEFRKICRWLRVRSVSPGPSLRSVDVQKMASFQIAFASLTVRNMSVNRISKYISTLISIYTYTYIHLLTNKSPTAIIDSIWPAFVRPLLATSVPFQLPLQNLRRENFDCNRWGGRDWERI